MQGIKFEYLKLHISVLLAGFTGILAKLIPMNEGLIVFYRMLFAFLIFCIMLFFMKKKPIESLSNSIKIIGLGALLSLHLIFDPSYRFGIVLGVISAALFALYTLFNQIVEVGKSTRNMLFYELFGGALFMLMILPIYLHFNTVSTILPNLAECFWLLILAFFCTVLLYLLHISVLKKLSAFTVGIAGNLEPIYGILLAVIFFGEAHNFTCSFYIGMFLILFSVFLQSISKMKSIENNKVV